MGLGNREIASVLWVLVAAIVVLAVPSTRNGVHSPWKALWAPKVIWPLLVLVLYTSALVRLGRTVHIWNSSMLGSTLFWFATVAIVLYGTVTDALKGTGYYRKAITQSVSIGVLVEFVGSRYPLPLGWEIVMQGFIAFVLLIAVAAPLSKADGSKAVGTAASAIAGAIGVLLLVLAVIGFVGDWGSVDRHALALDFALPVWLTWFSIPYMYLFAVVMAFEAAFIRMRVLTPKGTHTLHARAALFWAAGMRPHVIAGTKSNVLRAMAVAPGVRAAWRAYFDGLAERYEKEILETLKTDAERELEATAKALQWLANFQMGHYRNSRKYRRDLADLLEGSFESRGLPPEHGINMTVAAGGQSWHAWRQISDGHVLGIGAAKEPPDQWFYQSDRAPNGGPKAGRIGWWHQFDIPPEGSEWP